LESEVRELYGGIELAAHDLFVGAYFFARFAMRAEYGCLIDVNAANYSMTASRRRKRATPLRFLSA
jgi:hypothetical protein